MYRNENIKTQECIKKNGMINKGNKDTLTYEDLKKLDMDPYYKMSKKEKCTESRRLRSLSGGFH